MHSSSKRSSAVTYAAALGVLASVLACDTISAAAPATQPATQPSAGFVHIKKVELTLLGSIHDITGTRWPPGTFTLPGLPNFIELEHSAWIEEPCDLTLHLPNGRVMRTNTRPILIISQTAGVVTEVRFPPADAPPDYMTRQAAVMDRVLAELHATPNAHMRAMIEDARKEAVPEPDDPKVIGGFVRIGAATLDERSDMLFELSSGKGGKWTLVTVIEVGDVDSQRLLKAERARMEAAANAIARPGGR